jgi:chromosome condensin MukBEF MukE localization factor
MSSANMRRQADMQAKRDGWAYAVVRTDMVRAPGGYLLDIPPVVDIFPTFALSDLDVSCSTVLYRTDEEE